MRADTSPGKGFFDILGIDPFMASNSLSLTASAVSEGIDSPVHRPSKGIGALGITNSWEIMP